MQVTENKKNDSRAPGLRERKVARQKLEILDHITEFLKEQPLQNLMVDELCKKAMISRVTFYRYFPTRGHIISFYSSIWSFQVKTWCAKHNLKGLAALEYFFDFMGQSSNQAPYLYSSMFDFAWHKDKPDFKRGLTLAEMQILIPEFEGDPEEFDFSVGNFFVENCAFSIQNKEVNPSLTHDELTGLIATMFHGCGLAGIHYDPAKPGNVFNQIFKTLVKIIQPQK